MEGILWSLQLFADGISGETTAADAGQQSAGENPARAENTQDAAANPTRLTWEQILADPEYNRQIQATVRARLKAAQQAWEKKNTTDAESNVGADAHIGPQDGKPIPYEQGRIATAPAALRNDKPAIPAQEEAAPFTRGADRGDVESRLQRYYDGLVQQAEDLRKVFPDFSLPQALRNPEFVRLTAPHVGVSVENAYYLCNRQKHQAMAMALAARKTAEKLSSAVRCGYYRPVENGTAPQAPAVTSFDYAHATAQQRQALKSAIRRSASRGEKIYPEQIR